jgi:hypothetical protein
MTWLRVFCRFCAGVFRSADFQWLAQLKTQANYVGESDAVTAAVLQRPVSANDDATSSVADVVYVCDVCCWANVFSKEQIALFGAGA